MFLSKSTSAEAVISVLSRIFAMFGKPNTVKSYNGPPFNGENFAKLSRHLGFNHRKVTPLWPLANGCNERFMQSIKKVITTAIIEKKNWRTELTNFLKAYRAIHNGNCTCRPHVQLHSKHHKTTKNRRTTRSEGARSKSSNKPRERKRESTTIGTNTHTRTKSRSEITL